MVKVAVLGYGTVGSGVVEVLEKNKEAITKKAGQEVSVKYVLDLRDFPGDPVEKILVHDYNVILHDPEVKIIAEVMGGTGAAYTFTRQALEAGKSVCTSNKALVAAHGSELLRIAGEHQCNYMFEASCGGAIPIIRPLRTCLSAEVIDEVTGILNGTTNFILSEMSLKGSEFADVLKQAQDMGYAESNPEADVEGHDACRKIAILSTLAYGQYLDYQDVYTEGISRVSASDFKYASALGVRIKLLATSKKVGDRYYGMVAPVMIDAENPLYSVMDVFNAVFVHGNMLGDCMFYGKGAGKLPTASAVVSDIIDEARHLHSCLTTPWDEEKLPLMSIDEVENRFFVRMKGTLIDNLCRVEKVFGKVQALSVPELPDEFGFITDRMKEKEYREKAAQFDNVLSMIRVRF